MNVSAFQKMEAEKLPKVILEKDANAGSTDADVQAIRSFQKCIHSLFPHAMRWKFKHSKAKLLPQGAKFCG